MCAFVNIANVQPPIHNKFQYFVKFLFKLMLNNSTITLFDTLLVYYYVRFEFIFKD